MSYSRILIIQLKHLGDILLTTPVISALKNAWPQATVSALVPRGMEAMLTEHPRLQEILTMDRRDRSPWSFLKFAAGLRQRRFDLVLEFSGGDRGAFYTWLTGARTRISFDYPRRPALAPAPCLYLAGPCPPVAGPYRGEKPGPGAGSWEWSPGTPVWNSSGTPRLPGKSRISCSSITSLPIILSSSIPRPAGCSNAGPPRATPRLSIPCKKTINCRWWSDRRP